MIGNDHQQLVRQRNKDTIKKIKTREIVQRLIELLRVLCLLMGKGVSRQSPVEFIFGEWTPTSHWHFGCDFPALRGHRGRVCPENSQPGALAGPWSSGVLGHLCIWVS